MRTGNVTAFSRFSLINVHVRIVDDLAKFVLSSSLPTISCFFLKKLSHLSNREMSRFDAASMSEISTKWRRKLDGRLIFFAHFLKNDFETTVFFCATQRQVRHGFQVPREGDRSSPGGQIRTGTQKSR